MKLNAYEGVTYTALLIVFGFAVFFGFSDVDYYTNVFAIEDGAIEYSTALFLLLVSLISLYRALVLRKFKSNAWILGTFGFFVLFFFGAGEEISWGQRIFGIESGEFFQENNAQSETNLHNLVVGDTKINRLIFGQLLTISLGLYLVLGPILYRKKTWFKNLADKFAVPIVHWHHTIVFFVCTGLVLLIPSPKKWEVYELAMGTVFFLIFVNPLNVHIFRKENV